MNIEEYRIRLEQKRGNKQQIERSLTNVKSELNKLYKKRVYALEGIEIIKIVARETQQQIDSKITDVISLALSIIYDDNYEFMFDIKYRGGRTVVEPIFFRDGQGFPPGKQTGCGPLDIATMTLRIAIWSIIKLRPVIILDEPGKNLDSDAISRMEGLLQTLSNEFGLQFIIVTHEKELVSNASRVFKVTKKDNVSKVEEIQRIDKKE